MSRDVLTVGSTMRIPLLYRGEYSQWVERFMNYLEEKTNGEAMINSIKNGDQPLPRVTQVSIARTTSTEQPHLKDTSMCNKTAKDLWDAIARCMLGSKYSEQDRKAAVLYEYKTFKATEGELLLDTYIRYLQKQYATMIRHNKNLMDINIDALYNILKQNQGDVNDAIGAKKKTIVVTFDPLALIAEKTKVSKSKEKVVVSSDSEGSEADAFSELKKITALLAKAFNRIKFYSKPTNNNLRTLSTSQTLQQNGVVERRNQTLVEAARTMLTFANLPSFFRLKPLQQLVSHKIVRLFTNVLIKTPYELMNKRKPNIKFFRVFGCRCYLFNDYEDVGKLKEKGDIEVFVGYSKESAAFRIYNKRTRKTHKSVNVNFDEISEIASKQFSLEPGLSNLNKTGKSLNSSVSKVFEASKKDLEDLFQDFYDEYFDSSNIMKSSTTNVETSINEEVFHEVSESFQWESSSSSLNDNAQQSPEEVILPQTNTQSILVNMIPNGDEASTSHNVFNERLEDAYFDASIDYDETFALVAQIEAICLFLAYATHKDFTVFQIDVKTSFLNGIVKEEVYVGQPPGFVSMQYPDHVYALDKTLYGLKQAPRAWYDVLSQFLIESGFQKVPTPMVEQAKLKLNLVGKPVDHTDYRSMIGSLMYVTSSRPDIMFATCMCARYQANPNEHHVSAVKRIFRYLKWTINLGLCYPKDSGFDLTGYSDADHAGCHLDRKKSEYVAVSGCCTQVLWVHTQLTDYRFFYDKVPIYCDSKSAIAISCNPVQHTRTKHIDVRTGIDLPWSLPSHLGKLGLGDRV
nr:hypothetical protein [Tanacetum cinerariifolium]